MCHIYNIQYINQSLQILILIKIMKTQSLSHYQIQIKNLRKKLQSLNLNTHTQCKAQIQHLNQYQKQLKSKLKSQLIEKDKIIQAIQNKGQKAIIKDLSKSSPQVQKLKIQNFTLKNQLKNNYINPQLYFLQNQLQKHKEQQVRKDEQIVNLRKKLAILKKQSVIAKQRGLQLQKLQKYESLIAQNQQLKAFLNNPDYGTQQQFLLGNPQAQYLKQANKTIREKIEQFNRQILDIQSELQKSNMNSQRLLREIKEQSQRYVKIEKQEKQKQKKYLNLQKKYMDLQAKYYNLQKKLSQSAINYASNYKIPSPDNSNTSIKLQPTTPKNNPKIQNKQALQKNQVIPIPIYSNLKTTKHQINSKKQISSPKSVTILLPEQDKSKVPSVITGTTTTVKKKNKQQKGGKFNLDDMFDD